MPRLTLQRKAFLALAALLVVLVLLFAGFSRWALQRGLGPYVASIELARMDWLAERLQQHHAQSGGWNALRQQPQLWRQLRQNGPNRQGGPPPRPQGPREGGDNPPPQPNGQRDPSGQREPPGMPPPPPPDGGPPSVYGRLGLLDADGKLVAGSPPLAGAARLALADANGAAIGHLVLSPPDDLHSEADRAFLREHMGFVAWTGLAGLALALALSAWLARRWLAPVQALAEGARAIAVGRLDTRVPVAGDDELAQLTRTFNDMAGQLAGIEASRRQWLGDVAHELRTPLAAMRAEIEALQDGIRPWGDKTALRLHRQVMRLIQLVGDLRASLDGTAAAPAQHHVPVHPLALLGEALAAMQPRLEQARIHVQPPDAPAHAPLILGDAQQLHQVFNNLLENTLRYTHPGGQLHITADTVREDARRWLRLQWDDSAPGVADHELPHLFERLYRAESSRARAEGDVGGSGLGLAISRTIVQAHGGRITAQHSPLGGLRIVLDLPLIDTTTTP
ncbi:MAG: ATP-binding protein [Acidovorax sp.]|uniref:ATP-binding protein n=1 Tax=Acidovorax sp. TaxID=1872122 RepID=UPI0039E65F72